jgi:hypothetical protein
VSAGDHFANAVDKASAQRAEVIREWAQHGLGYDMLLWKGAGRGGGNPPVIAISIIVR